MSENDREPRGKKTDRRVLIASAIVVAVVLVLFIIYDAGFQRAGDATTGGADMDSIPTQTEETAPEAQQNPL